MNFYFDFLDNFYRSGGGTALAVLKFFSGVISLVLLAILANVIRLTWQLNSPLKRAEEAFALEFGAIPASSRTQASKQWRSITDKAQSQSQSDWKLAVIEADSLVDDLLKLAQYSGDTMGERLKQLDTAKLPSLNALWEAHKIRNIIAHDPARVLTRPEIDHALEGFKKALDELEFLDETVDP
ncbi:MAG: hypothetical protein A3I44_05020 [Candidatus Sungbacteria bacterium RIFCSPLOWO2_02_FULL_51_17]|nr:MAG: hypothetical protein A2676_03720 [Candidatus Sungbacteria bacterium RIFCSPHIGHO2_01_FULL_51_22]OHA05570.1 MAG: hypothetical protein A3B29_02750 [Candidatus Sungbacteria bacterium RIFCSPLOWO2_01_FULL_51_34]OHA11702.1 MAG: hypothetical protein A3I44_05020 [Candidatus Sungbacteria bacterium RIFCSPLOWO2_02_FULL_51_17]